MRQAQTDLQTTAVLTPAPNRTEATAEPFHQRRAYLAAWALCLVFYFLQYALRSAPGVMIPELTTAFSLTTLGVSSLLGLYCRVGGGALSCPRASLRPPLKLNVRFSRIQLS